MNTSKIVPLSELEDRLKRFRLRMDKGHPNWQMAVIFSKLNMFYFTGTMQEGMLIIPKDEAATLWIRRSYERALEESLFPQIKPMSGFKEAAAFYGKLPSTVYLETEIVPLALYQRLQKYFPFSKIEGLDRQISAVRAIKSDYELSFMKISGEIHRIVLEEKVPKMLWDGLNEAEFAGELYSVMIQEGHHGLARFGMFDTEMVLGHVAFGESSIYPTYFDGPGGAYGLSPGVPLLGSRESKLKRGDLIFVDIGCGYDGYHTDKTMTYTYGDVLPDYAIYEHQKCVQIQNDLAKMLKPGAIPSKIYSEIMDNLSPEFLENFMGYGKRQVKFLGHGIGLVIDEFPVIAKGFDEPLEENMVFALEPKKGIKDIGMVGIENTFIVTKDGGKCITGDHPGLILIEGTKSWV